MASCILGQKVTPSQPKVGPRSAEGRPQVGPKSTQSRSKLKVKRSGSRHQGKIGGYATPPTPNREAPMKRPPQPGPLRRGAGPPRFRRIYFLAAPPDPGTARNEFLSTVGCSGLDSQLLGTILRPLPTTFAFSGPGPLSEHLTHFQILEIQLFSNSPRDYAH